MTDVQTIMFRTAGAMNVRLYRSSKGRLMGKARGLPLLLLTINGRKTGTPHTTLVSYIMDDGRYVVCGSGGGSKQDPQWFRNLRRAEHAVIEVGPQRMDVAVALAGPAEHPRLWAQLVAKQPGFARYQQKVERQIPLALLTPVTG